MKTIWTILLSILAINATNAFGYGKPGNSAECDARSSIPSHYGVLGILPRTPRTIAAAIAGGLSAVAGGGKFANGAVSGAFVHLFNEEIQSNTAFRALNESDRIRIDQGLGLVAKNVNGDWSPEQHVYYGSSESAWDHDPWISVTESIDVAMGYNVSSPSAGNGYGIVAIDMMKINTHTATYNTLGDYFDQLAVPRVQTTSQTA